MAPRLTSRQSGVRYAYPDTNELSLSPEELAGAFLDLSSLNDVADLLELSPSLMKFVLYGRGPERYYKTWTIKKRSGGLREISAPRGPLYVMQSRLNRVLTAIYRPKPAVHGFVRGRSVVTNARPHAASRHVLNVDLEDFFPSINFGRVRGLMLAPPYNRPSEVATSIAKICCANNHLPIGAPTSPVVANMLCRGFDADLTRLARHHGCRYTRYADDLTFSTLRRVFPPGLVGIGQEGNLQLGRDLVTVISSHGFRSNGDKLRLQSNNTSQRVTGVVVNEFPNLDRKYVREIRAMLHSWNRYGLGAAQAHFLLYDTKDRYPGCEPRFERSLDGKISYLSMVRGAGDPIVQRFRKQYRNLANGDPIQTGIGTPVEVKEDVTLRERSVRILHLSDLHFAVDTAWDAIPLLKRLTEVLTDIRPIDLVVVTGDVAAHGMLKEYERAEHWLVDEVLSTLGVAPDGLYLVPGNHDVDRNQAKELIESLHGQLLSSADGNAQLQRILESTVQAAVLRARFSEYLDFTTRCSGVDTQMPWWGTRCNIDGVSIGIVGLCSALFSRQDGEKGRLMLGLPQVNVATGDAGFANDINIALMHHPFSYFADSDSAAVAELDGWMDIMLRGHLHEEDAVETRAGSRRRVILGGASAYQGSQYTNGVQVVEVFPVAKRCEVTPFRWDARSRRWYRSRDVFDEDPAGIGKFTFGSAEERSGS